MFRSILDGKDAGIGVKTLHPIAPESYVTAFTGVWAYHDDVDCDVALVEGEADHSFREDECVVNYAASFGGTVIDADSIVDGNLIRSRSHRLMCVARHDREAVERTSLPQVRYDPSDRTTPADVGGLFNHATTNDPACNCQCVSCIVKTSDGMRIALIVSTTRAVAANEELRWDYHWSPDDDASAVSPETSNTFNLSRDTTPWTAPRVSSTAVPVPDIDSLHIIGRAMARDWSMQMHKDHDHMSLFDVAWCGPRVFIRTLPTGMSAVLMVQQPSGDGYRRTLPDLVRRHVPAPSQ